MTTDLVAEARAWFIEHWDPARPLGDWWSDLACSGWGFPHYPREWFGRGATRAQAVAVDAERRAVGAYGPPSGIGTMMVAPLLLEMGTDEQKRDWIPGILDGTDAWCQLFSEPGAGSDLAGLSTKAKLRGDKWIVNGQKVWTSGGHFARRAILVARTDPTVPKHRGLTFFVMEMDQPGVEPRPLVQMNGDAEFNEVFLDDAVVPHQNVIGEVDGGWGVTLRLLSFERESLDPEASGLHGAMDLSISAGDYLVGVADDGTRGFMPPPSEAWAALTSIATERGADHNPVIRQRMAQIYSWNEIARFSALRSTSEAAAGKRPGPMESLGKLASVRIMKEWRDLVLEILGADGQLVGSDAPAEGLYAQIALTVPGMSIAGGTDEIQRNIVAERVLGLPREPQVDKGVPYADLPH